MNGLLMFSMLLLNVFLVTTAFDPKLLAVGGYSVRTEEKTSEIFDFTISYWGKLSDMATRRYALAVATLNGKVYAIGGIDERREALQTVEVFDPIGNNKWTPISGMNVKRASHGVGVLANKIYVVGGTSGSTTVLSDVETFDETSNRWTVVAGHGMNTKRQFLGVGVLANNLYAVGGHDGIVGGLL